MSNRWHWIGPASGVLAFVLFLVGSGLGGWHIPGALNIRPEGSAESIAGAFADNAGTFWLAANLGLLAAFFLLLFAADLQRRIALREAGRGWLSALALTGGVVWAGALVYQNSLALAADVIAREGLSPEIARLILALQWSNLNLLAGPVAAVIFAVGLVSLTSRFLPRWYAWLGMGLAAVALASLAIPFSNPLFMAILAAWLWVGGMAVILLWQSFWEVRREQEGALAAEARGSN